MACFFVVFSEHLNKLGVDIVEWIKTVDPNILFWIQKYIASSTLNPYMLALSKIGNAGMIWIFFSFLALTRRKYRLLGVAILLALTISLLVGEGILKPLVARVRPCINYPWVHLLIHTPKATNYSFPSGHTFASFAAAMAIFSANKKIGIFALMLAAAIGFSRLYLFMHYPSDVLAGALFGSISGVAAYGLCRHLVKSSVGQKISSRYIDI